MHQNVEGPPSHFPSRFNSIKLVEKSSKKFNDMETTNEFGHFDVVSDDSDHHFLGSNKGKCFTDIKSGVYRAIMREWKILQKNLPERIYVRVYERRIDLMRAVIVGAAGTPYHDGLFFFDMAFPSDYPNRPPKVYYHSFGYRLNPNLYKTGRVCLSLLNTWHGGENEKWDPCGSTMLQVLVSIQGLVLNEYPFYNEPGALNARAARAYNENVFIFTCYTSFVLLHRPLRNFEAFVRAHFRERAFPILAACNEYVNGRLRIGYCSYHLPLSSSTVRVSREFKARMVQFYPRFFLAFKRNGASLEGLVEHLVVESEQSKSKGSGVFKKVMEKIKRTLGWKKNGKKKISEIEGNSREISQS